MLKREKGEVKREKFKVNWSWHSIWQRSKRHQQCQKNCQWWKSIENKDFHQSQPKDQNHHWQRHLFSSRFQLKYINSLTLTNSSFRWKLSENCFSLWPPLRTFQETSTTPSQASGENNAQIPPSFIQGWRGARSPELGASRSGTSLPVPMGTGKGARNKGGAPESRPGWRRPHRAEEERDGQEAGRGEGWGGLSGPRGPGCGRRSPDEDRRSRLKAR